MELNQKRVLVVGTGKSGRAATELLTHRGAAVILTDTRPRAEWPDADGLSALGASLAEPNELQMDGLDLVVLSPGVAIDDPLAGQARAHGVEVIGEVELASYYLQGPIIGITGSNGKTTTTAMVGHILQEAGVPAQVGGNIGVAPTAMVDTSRPDQWNVLELSSFQLETIRTFSAKIGIVLNITPDHLDRHHTLENYAAAKRRLVETQRPAGHAILNADDPATVEFATHATGQVAWFSQKRGVAPGIYRRNGNIALNGGDLMPVADIPLPGSHNVENVMAASLAAHLAGVAHNKIAAAVRTFPGVEHRIEFTRELNGVRYYNDSKATNVDATQKAIDSFPGGLWIILGGKDKGSDYTVLNDSLRQKARAALLIGAAAEKIASQLNGGVPTVHCGTLDQAVDYAHQHAVPGDIVLLAPACASFDQFQNFEHRGRVFKELVRQLA